MNTITLYKSETCWMARFSGEHREEVVRLFGCDSIPVPFTPQTDGEEVQRVIQWMNPRCGVVVDADVLEALS